MIRKKLTSCIGVFLLLWLASCSHNDKGAGTDAATYIPDAPDYADATMWYTRENSTVDKGADVFYLVSTWETDWTTADGRVCHYADVHNATHRANMDKEISRIAGYMGEAGDFYSPYYRHITIEGWATLKRTPSTTASAPPSATCRRPLTPSSAGAPTPTVPLCWRASARAARRWWSC